MRRGIYDLVLAVLFSAGGLATLFILLAAESFRGLMFTAPACVSSFAAYLLYDDFVKPWLGQQSKS